MRLLCYRIQRDKERRMSSPEPQVIELLPADTIESAAAKLNIQPKSLIVLLGDFDVTLNAQIRSICSRAIAPLAVNPGALIIDDGVKSGCAALIGEAARDQDQPLRLLGIVASGAGERDPNHMLLLHLPAEWSDPAKARFQIAGQLAKEQAGKEKPVLTILIGGGETENAAVIRCARREWPVLLIQGSGGLADQIATALAPPPDGTLPDPISDPGLREIVETASLYSFPIAGNVDDLKRILLSRIELRTDTLADAWARHDDLDQAAIVKQKLFRTVQAAVLTLGIMATVLAIAQSNAVAPDWFKVFFPASFTTQIKQYSTLYRQIMHVLMILTPISISVLVTANSRFREGNKWILLRAAAEAIKREIFRYRAQAGAYSDEQCVHTSRESKLAAKIKDISSALSQSEVNRTSLPRCVRDAPERLRFLSPEEYVTYRLEDQVDHYVTKTRSLYTQLKRAQLCIYLAGGAGSLLAALNSDVWVALTTAVATALTTKLETEQAENALVQYNQALMNLRNIASWWKALSQWEKSRRKNIDLLVDQTEKTLEGELAGWVQQMQSALDKLTEKEEPRPGQQSLAAKA